MIEKRGVPESVSEILRAYRDSISRDGIRHSIGLKKRGERGGDRQGKEGERVGKRRARGKTYFFSM